MAGPVEWCSPDNHTCSFVSRPLVKAVCGNWAPAGFHGIAERGLGAHRFRSGIDQSGGGRRVFRPAWNESPAHQRQFTGGYFRILADDCYRLSGGYVVTRAPVFFPRDGIEVLLDDLLSPRQLAAPAHEGNYGRSDERFTRPSKVVVGGRNISVQTFALIPHASSKFWGTYLLSLCFCAHSLSGIELRYSFSDSFNLRTISSNEVGVTGMAPIGLSQFELPLIRNFAAPHKHPKLMRDAYKRTKVTSRSASDRLGGLS